MVEEVETGRRVAYTWEEGHRRDRARGGRVTGRACVVTETGEPGWNAVFSLRAIAYAYA